MQVQVQAADVGAAEMRLAAKSAELQAAEQLFAEQKEAAVGARHAAADAAKKLERATTQLEGKTAENVRSDPPLFSELCTHG